MSCREFEPSIEKFCSNPADFVSEAQLVQMAGYFEIKGAELAKIKTVASREVSRRTLIASGGTGTNPQIQQQIQQKEG